LPGDLAIDGDGFFIVKDPKTNALLYTRNGNFALNRDGKLANPEGLIAQGFNVDSAGNALPLVEDINISGQSFPPKQSANTTVHVNLDSTSPLITDPTTGTIAAFAPTDPVKTSQFSTALTVYDSLGTGHTVDIYFQKTADNNWNWFMGTRANELANQTGTSLVVVGSGTLTFTNDGALDTVNTTGHPRKAGQIAVDRVL
jgi:flagellar hook protein FlgE